MIQLKQLWRAQIRFIHFQFQLDDGFGNTLSFKQVQKYFHWDGNLVIHISEVL